MGLLSKFTAPAEDVVEKPDPAQVEADGYVKVTSRLNAWWDGKVSETDDGVSEGERTEFDIALDDGVPSGIENWDEIRTQVAESIWGEGFINPGSGQFLTKCMAPARINKKKNILELSAGLGGTAIMLAREAGVWVDAIESDPSLVEKAQRIISSTPVSAQIEFHRVDYDTFVIPPKSYHVIYSRERLFISEFKQQVMEQVAVGLKEGGQFLLLDYVVAPDFKTNQITQDWVEAEICDVHPWTMNDYSSAFKKNGLHAPKPDDFSQAMIEEINMAWSRMLARLESGAIDRSLVNHIVVEGDIWQKRIKALRSGSVKLLRFNASKR